MPKLFTSDLSKYICVWMVDGRLGSQLQGYHPVAPRPLRCGPFVQELSEKWSVNLACDFDFHVNRRALLHAANL
jgi:hypothetical protein